MDTAARDVQNLKSLFGFSSKTTVQTVMTDIVKLMTLAEQFSEWSGSRKKQAVLACARDLIKPLTVNYPWLEIAVEALISPAIDYIVQDFVKVARSCGCNIL